jgi:hypothetical protein
MYCSPTGTFALPNPYVSREQYRPCSGLAQAGSSSAQVYWEVAKGLIAD